MAPASLLKKPVFAVTNFGTRIVIAISPDCAVGDFKKEFENAHLSCFPEFGKIRVHSLKVRRKSCFYDLSELFPLRYAFQGAKGWFLHIVAHRVQNQSASRKDGRRLKRKKWKKRRKFPCFKSAFLEVPRAVYFLKRKKKKCHELSKIKDSEHGVNGVEQGTLKSNGRVLAFASGADDNWGLGGNLGVEGKECLSETISETISVSGIISRYFSSCDEVNSNSRLSFMELQAKSKEQMKAEIASDYRNIQFGMPSPLVAKTPPQVHCQVHCEPSLRSLEEKSRTNIGVRVVEASKSLRLSTTKKIALSLSKFIDGGSVVTRSANTHIRRLIFEISDEDD